MNKFLKKQFEVDHRNLYTRHLRTQFEEGQLYVLKLLVGHKVIDDTTVETPTHNIQSGCEKESIITVLNGWLYPDSCKIDIMDLTYNSKLIIEKLKGN